MSDLLALFRAHLSIYPSLEAHSLRVAHLAWKVAEVMGLPVPGLIRTAGLLHDLGKSLWPPELFTKYTLLLFDRALVKAHPVAGENLLVEIWPEAPAMLRSLVRGHHERPGGNGYPDGLAEPGTELLLLAACDAYDAMTHEREYRPGGVLFPREALIEVARFAPAGVVAALGKVIEAAGVI